MPVLSGQKNIKTMFTLILAVLICFPLSGCQNSDLNYTVEEEKAAGAYLGNIATDSGIMNEFEPQEKALIRFVRLTLAGATQLFNVSQMTGKLYTARQLDAETLCDRSATCFQTLDVAVKKEETLMKLLSIKVFLKDINDHAPKFPSEKVHLEFLEGDTNTRRSIPNAIDKDVGTQNSQVTYQLRKKHNEPFRLTVSKKPDGSSDLNLYVDKKLDRERRQEYKVQIIAKDNGLPAKQSILDVDISVADLNDNTPTFVKSVYNVSTKNEPSDTRPIVTVLAMDPDLGENGRVTYKFSPLTSDAAKDHFKLNEDTGEIMLVKKISAGQSTVYELFVEASDGATLPLSAQVVVTVHVIPSHNNPPVIFVNFVSASPDKKTALVLEGAVTDSFIAYVKVVDHDVGHSGEVSCALVHEHFQLRSLGAEKYKVVVKKPVDRETKVKHNVTISCQDRGSPSLRSESTFAIEVVDINDNSPVFLKEDYRTSFSENNVVGMSLLQVLAKDSDVGYNGEIRFFLDATTSSWFTIGEKSGLITVTSIFDREKTPKTDFKVYARDLGKPSLTGSATVHVTINDINDEHPVFTQDSFRFKTYENQIPKFPVGYINASDPDLGAGGELTYTLKAEDKEMLPFIISDDGFLSVNKLLDYELQSAYKFKVLVEDNGSPSFNNTVDVLVEVLDENDNEPYFLFPSMNNFSMTVYYYPDSDKDITVLQAKDKDSDENALLKFEIAGGNDKGLFLVDTYSGLLSFDREATREDTGQYQLQFIVKDSGVPVQSATANLSLSLVVSNETSNLAGLQVDDDVTSHQNLLIVIALTAVTGSVGLVVVLTICLIRRNDRRDRRNAANHMGPLGTSGCHPPASKCMPSSHISTGLDLTPSLSMDNNLKGNSTFRSSQRSPYCDTNVFSPSKSSEMLQTATLSAGQDRMSVQDGKLCHVGATPTYDCRSELSTGSSNNDSGHGWSEGDTGHVTEESDNSRPLSTSHYIFQRPRNDARPTKQRSYLTNVETNPYVRGSFRPKVQDLNYPSNKNAMMSSKLSLGNNTRPILSSVGGSLVGGACAEPIYWSSRASSTSLPTHQRPPMPQTQLIYPGPAVSPLDSNSQHYHHQHHQPLLHYTYSTIQHPKQPPQQQLPSSHLYAVTQPRPAWGSSQLQLQREADEAANLNKQSSLASVDNNNRTQDSKLSSISLSNSNAQVLRQGHQRDIDRAADIYNYNSIPTEEPTYAEPAIEYGLKDVIV